MKVVIEMLTRRVDYARFRKVYYSEAFSRELIAAIHLRERTIREHVQLPDGKVRIRVYVAPKVELPNMIAKLVEGHVIGYEELSIYDPATRRSQVSVHTAGGDRLHVSAETVFIDEADGIRTRIELSVAVKIFGVGALVERFVVNETRKRYEAVERVLQQFVDTGASGDDDLQAARA